LRRGVRFAIDRLEGRDVPSVTSFIFAPAGAPADYAPITDDAAQPANVREVARRAFAARFEGPLRVGPPRTVDQARSFRITGPGSAIRFLHGTLDMAFFTPTAPGGRVTGVIAMTDRSTNSGGLVLGNIQGDPRYVDRLGRPTLLAFSVDPNSGGIFNNAAGFGTIAIRYRGGRAYVTVRASINTYGVGNPLATVA